MAKSTNDEAKIRERIDSWATALRAKDVDGLMAHYAPDAVTADLAPPLWNAGAGTLRKNFEEWLATWAAIGIEIRDVHVTAGSDVAFARSSNRIYGTKLDGESSDVWVRATICFRKQDGGAWKVVHEHVSVPFYMDGSFRAAVDLKP